MQKDKFLEEKNMNFAYCKTKYRIMISRCMSPFFVLLLSTFSLWRLYFLWKCWSLKRCKTWLLGKKVSTKFLYFKKGYKWKGLLESINKNKLYLKRVVSTAPWKPPRGNKRIFTLFYLKYTFADYFKRFQITKDNLCTKESFVNQIQL